MTDKFPKIENAPGLVWRRMRNKIEARWLARSDLAERGWHPRVYRVWAGREDEMTEIDRAWISDRCSQMQSEMLVWGRGGIPHIGMMDGTLKSLIEAYQTDPDSTYHKLRYQTRLNHAAILRRLRADYGHVELTDIKARLLLGWHKGWSEGGKISMAHGFVAELRTLFGFGFTILENEECERLCMIMHKLRFPMANPRREVLTAEQASAIRAEAHRRGYHSLALAQALQFELILRQKDCIGEWVPISEPGTSEVVDRTRKWLRGLRWSEIERRGDGALILRHTTSKRGKDIEVDLRHAPMVMDELGRIGAEMGNPGDLPTTGPMIVSENTGLPYANMTFRGIWRQTANAAGIPKAVKNMDSRAGGITEATDAGASLEQVRHAATHSNAQTTANYSRGAQEKTAQVQKLRTEFRNKK